MSDCARESCGKPATPGRSYCSSRCAVLCFAQKQGMKTVERHTQEAIGKSDAAKAAASERMKNVQAAMTPEERKAKMAHLRQLRKEKRDLKRAMNNRHEDWET